MNKCFYTLISKYISFLNIKNIIIKLKNIYKYTFVEYMWCKFNFFLSGVELLIDIKGIVHFL